MTDKKIFVGCLLMIITYILPPSSLPFLEAAAPIHEKDIDLETLNITDYSNTILLQTSFEEKWTEDIDGDHLAPPGWDVEGICKSNQQGLFWATHYWSQLYDYEQSLYDLSYNGSASACIWWSDGHGEGEIGTAQDEWLITPTLNFSGFSYIELSFYSVYMWRDADNNCWIEISLDNGSSWDTITDLSHDKQWELGGNVAGWSGWNKYECPITIDLSNYIGNNEVKIAWHYYTSGEGVRAIWVIDEVRIVGNDIQPPSIKLIKPQPSTLYLFGEPFIYLKKNITIVIGSINISVEARDNAQIDRVEFYVDGVLKETDYLPPYSWEWDLRSFGRHTLMVVAYDTSENKNYAMMNVWKFL